jgi:hypothetical protein
VLSGRVLGADDQPVAGALVTASDDDRQATAASDPDGGFAVTGLPPGRYALTARGDHQVSTPPIEVSARVGEPTEDLVLRMSATASVRGKVVAGGAPVAGAEVVLTGLDPDDPRFASAVSQADGGFVVDGVLPGPQSIAVLDHDVVAPDRVVAAAPETSVTIEVRRRGGMRGRVVRGGGGVEGARVTARPTTGVDAVGWQRFRNQRSAVSGKDGAFELTGLVASSYSVSAETDTAFTRDVAVEVAAGQLVEGVTIELDLAATVAGVVVDQRGAPVPDVHVQLELDRKDWGFAQTDEDGAFRAGAMSGGGDYAITVARARGGPPYPPAPGAPPAVVTLRDGDSHVEGVRVAIRVDQATIAGRVVDAAGAPLPDVAVVAMLGVVPDGQPGDVVAHATSGADGGFVLRDLLTGSYRLEGTSGSGQTAEAVGVAAGAVGVVLRMPAAGAIEGTLTGFGPRVAVRASAASDRGFLRYRPRVTGDRFVLRELPPGPYFVSARAGDAMADAEVEVVAGETAAVALAPLATGAIDGRLYDVRDRAPVADASCFARLTDGGAVGGREVTDADGRFRLVVVAGRSVEVACHHGRGLTRTTIEVKAGAARALELPVVLRREPGEGREVGLSLMEAPPLVTVVVPGGLAAAAGVEPRDLIVSIDGIAVDGLHGGDVLTLLRDRPADARARVVLRRAGVEKTITL